MNILPTFMAFYAPKNQHKHPVTKSHTSHQPEFGHGQHDVSWDLIKKRHLAIPPAHFKIEMAFAIFLLLGLFFYSPHLLFNLIGFNFSRAKARVLIPHRYLYLQSFLI